MAMLLSSPDPSLVFLSWPLTFSSSSVNMATEPDAML